MAATIVTACGSSSAARHPEAAVEAMTIAIHNFKFSPTPLTVKAGTTVTVTNDDGTNHTLTADDHSFDTGPFDSGSKTIQLTNPGRFAYHCAIHNFMTGVVEVTQ